MKKSIRTSIVAVLTAIFLCLTLSSCLPKSPVRKEHVLSDKQKTVLYLGDSIAEAVAGPSPLTERESYGYYGILGNINNFKFYNRAISGDKTSDLLQFIDREDDGINMVRSLVSTADIIHISIGGNDILGHDINQMLVDVANGSTAVADAYMETAYENLDKIITRLRTMNPDAIIITQTVYNPVGKHNPLINNYAKMRLANMAYTENDIHNLSGIIINRINKMLKRYQKENENKFEYEPYYLVDVYSAFEEIYKANPSRWETLFCPDGIHPANEGHAIIAEANQKLLEELKLTDKNALANYKTLRSEQLERLYSNAVEVSSVKKIISDCDSFSDVTLAYFNATRDKDADYRHKIPATIPGKHFDTDTRFRLTNFSVRGLSLLKVYVPKIKTYFDIIDYEKSGIRFNADGTFKMTYQVDRDLIVTLKQLLDWGFFSLPFNLSELADMDINYLQSKYLKHMFPGFDYANLVGSLELFSEATGFTIRGVDFSAQSAREMANELARSGDLILSDIGILQDDLAITWEGTYRLVEQKSELTGETYTAIYINEEFYKGESYLRFTCDLKPDDLATIRMTVDVADLVLEGIEE